MYEELSEKVFASGDAVGDHHAFETFLAKLKAVRTTCAIDHPCVSSVSHEQVKNAEHPFTLILDDPLANSYLQNLYAPDPDPNMTIESYDRTWDQNEELGLNDMKVENYEEGAEVSETDKLKDDAEPGVGS